MTIVQPMPQRRRFSLPTICGLLVCLAALVVGAAIADTPSPLGEPTVRVDQVAPALTADEFTLPDKPSGPTARLAARTPSPKEPAAWRAPDLPGPERPKPIAPVAKKPAEAAGPKLTAPAEDATDDDAEEAADAGKANGETADAAKEPDDEQASDADAKRKRRMKRPQKAPATASAADPPAPLPRGLRNLKSRMRTVLSYYYRQPLNTVQHDPWEIMHGMLAYELYSRVRNGGPRGAPMTAVGHLCFNRPSKRQRMMRMSADGDLDVEVGVGLQGHLGQFLAMLAQCNVDPDYPIRVGSEELTIEDLVLAEQKTCYPKTELTFKLIGLGHYLASDAEWTNDRGERWDIPRLIREERTQPIRGAACGGTHRLSGLGLAYRRREARGETIDGEYLEAARFVSQYQTQAFRLQNSDGSLSTEWFRGRGAEESIDRRLRTTGHLLEWLAYTLPDEQLRSRRMVSAVSYLTTLLAHNADYEWHLGSLGHALHALVVYDKRVFQPHDTSDNIAGNAKFDASSGRYRGYAIYRGVMRNHQPQPSGFFGLFGSSNASKPSNRSRR